MTKRSPIAVVLLSLFVPFYAWYWYVFKTKAEMVRCGANIPTAWIFLIPFAGLYWMWKFAGGVEHVTQGKQSQAITFILLFFISPVGQYIVQSAINEAIDRGGAGQIPAARVA